MPLPNNTAEVLIAAGYDSLSDFIASASGGDVSLQWFSGDSQPTEQQIIDWGSGTTNLPSGLTFAQWKAINGGDVLLTLRDRAKQFFTAQKYESAAIRAFMLLVLDELNAHTTKTNAILAAIDNAASFTNLKTNIAAIADLPIRTATQLKTSINNKLDAGDGDT